MAEVFLNNPRHLLVAVRYEFFQKKSSFEAYKSFCKVFGNDAIQFKDFDFWWNRFEKGLFDIDYDRSQDPPTHDFTDIPDNALAKILDKLEWAERCNFRKVSKKYRRAVDYHPYVFRNIEYRRTFRTSLSIDNEIITYHNFDWWNFSGEGHLEVVYRNNRTRVRGSGSDYCAIQELLIALKNPNIEIKKLTWHLENFSFFQHIGQLLDTLEHRIHVECIELRLVSQENNHFDDSDDDYWDVDNWDSRDEDDEELEIDIEDHLMSILPYLKPGILEKIILSNETVYFKFPSVTTGEIGQLEQWKEAKHLRTMFDVPLDSVTHFDRLEMYGKSISMDDFIPLKDSLSRSPSFEYCCLSMMTYRFQKQLQSLEIELREKGIQMIISGGTVELKKN